MRSRLERALDKRDDLVYDLNHWGWMYTPSQKRALLRRIARAEARVTRLNNPARCWCGGEVGPRIPGDSRGLGCLENVMHEYASPADTASGGA